MLFWIWPLHHRKEARNDLPLWLSGCLPKWRYLQLPPKTLDERNFLKLKISNVLENNYLDMGYVTSLVPFFCFPKGEDDVLIVYNVSKSYLNDCIWTPLFPVRNANSLFRLLSMARGI